MARSLRRAYVRALAPGSPLARGRRTEWNNMRSLLQPGTSARFPKHILVQIETIAECAVPFPVGSSAPRVEMSNLLPRLGYAWRRHGPIGLIWVAAYNLFYHLIGRKGRSGGFRWTPIVRQPEPVVKV